ncbi:MAG: hypothetical protein J5877_01250 [Clostridia bacterium]|nr:hypothetical protein [Clostridia bacterium]
MKKEKRAKKSSFEKRLIYAVFGFTLVTLVGVLIAFAVKIINVEKNHPVLISEDYSSVTYDGSYFYAVDEVPEDLTAVEMKWLGGARHEGESRFDQAFRDRLIYALYKDKDGHRYIWVRDGDFYKENYQWALWEKDYKDFKEFEDSYFYKER